MIRPVRFRHNDQTAVNNYYQKGIDNLTSKQIQAKALLEFDNFTRVLESAGVNVIIIEDTKKSDTPDSIFPNNWVSFHSNGMACVFPMCAENRREERREDIFNILVDKYSFDIKEIKDLTSFEKHDRFLEGTGSMVLDRVHKICYAAISARTDDIVVKQFCKYFGYVPVCFNAYQEVNKSRLPIYHTNVMMCIADRFAIICLDTIDNRDERDQLVELLLETGKEIIEITEEQKYKFAGNMLQVFGNQPYLVMSTSAFVSLTDQQKRSIEKYCPIIHSSLDTIELCGGGSARCMMVEVFLPKK